MPERRNQCVPMPPARFRPKQRGRSPKQTPPAPTPAPPVSVSAHTLATPPCSISISTCSPRPRFALLVPHLFTYFTARYVQLRPARLDELLTPDAFRAASEPLFDNSHVDRNLRTPIVFPRCDLGPVFLNALFYATVWSSTGVDRRWSTFC